MNITAEGSQCQEPQLRKELANSHGPCYFLQGEIVYELLLQQAGLMAVCVVKKFNINYRYVPPEPDDRTHEIKYSHQQKT